MFSDTPPPTCAAASALPKTSVPAATTSSTVRAGFHESVVFSGLTNPVNINFASNGLIFVGEKSGLLLDYSSVTDTTPTVFADLRTEVDDFWDRGLLGVALSPNFPTTPYIFAYFGYDGASGQTAPEWHDACPTPPGATTDGCVISGRLVRLTADAATGYTKMVASSEVTIIKDQWCQQFPSHSNDTVKFGPDGALYLTAGDGANFNNVDYGQEGGSLAGDKANPCGDPPHTAGTADSAPTAEGGALRAQSFRRASGEPTLLNGAILRLNPASLTGDGMANIPITRAAASISGASRPMACATRSASPSVPARTRSGSATWAGIRGKRSIALPIPPPPARTLAGPATRAITPRTAIRPRASTSARASLAAR
jgi:hypothetical protein